MATNVDSWYRPAPFFTRSEWKEIDSADVMVVSEPRQGEALKLLEELPWRKLSAKEAEDLSGKAMLQVDGSLVLLRAISLNEQTGGFWLTWRSGNVRVHHGCLGRSPRPMIRRALVARLPGLPVEVYIDCSMDE